MNNNLRWLCEKNTIDILTPDTYDLISNFSMNIYGLAFLRNEIILNKRINILEFGSGLSTIFMALVIKKFSLPAKIVSVEAEQQWVDRIEKKILEIGISSIVTIIRAPLKPVQSLGKNNKWYDLENIPHKLADFAPFDMVLIDGPPAYSEDISLSRFMAAPFIKRLLAEEYSIFLDDASRQGEKMIMAMWKKQLNLDFKTYDNRIAISRKGPFINSHPSYLNNRMNF